MVPSMAFHRITRLEIRPVQHYPPSHDRKEPFWAREIRIHGEEGESFTMGLYADSADALYLPGETWPEREIVAQAKAGEAAVAVG